VLIILLMDVTPLMVVLIVAVFVHVETRLLHLLLQHVLMKECLVVA